MERQRISGRLQLVESRVYDDFERVPRVVRPLRRAPRGQEPPQNPTTEGRALPVPKSLRRQALALCSLLSLTGIVACEPDNAAVISSDGAATEAMPHDAIGAHSIVQPSESGAYRVAIQPEDPAASRAATHAWLVRIESEDGSSIRPTRLAFSGGMPQHGHGFQTAPYVTDALDGGWFRVGGVRFHMAGDWMLRVEFVGPAGPDVAVFQLAVAP